MEKDVIQDLSSTETLVNAKQGAALGNAAYLYSAQILVNMNIFKEINLFAHATYITPSANIL